MRTISSQAEKGQEPPRTLRDDASLLLYITRVAYAYFIKGRPVRQEFLRRQARQETLYVEDVKLP